MTQFNLEEVVTSLIEDQKRKEEMHNSPKVRAVELMQAIVESEDNLDGFADQVLNLLSELSGEDVPELHEFRIEVSAKATMRGFTSVAAFDEDHARKRFENGDADREVEWNQEDPFEVDMSTISVEDVVETGN